jgi:hypothetical protein
VTGASGSARTTVRPVSGLAEVREPGGAAARREAEEDWRQCLIPNAAPCLANRRWNFSTTGVSRCPRWFRTYEQPHRRLWTRSFSSRRCSRSEPRPPAESETEINANSGAQFEISIERVPRTYRDREDIAPSKRGDLRIRRVDTLEMAKTDEASWKKWKAWAKAGRGR